MTETHPGLGAGAARMGTAEERLRTYSIVVYVLYLLAAPSIFSTMLIGVIVAYLKRDEARGSAFESHFANAIEVFWLTLVVGLVAFFLWPLFFLGAVIHAALFVWILYRTVKGLLRAVEWQPYS
jgi:uncharacterized membrane protein